MEPTAQPAETEFFVDGYRWFSIDLTPRPHPARPAEAIVAKVSIDLAASEQPTEWQFAWSQDPVTDLVISHRVRQTARMASA